MATKHQHFEWVVIGAGPAGIAAIGKLLDHGVPSEKIGWLDPHFQVGDFGRKWQAVPSNTRVELFSRFLLNCRSFGYVERPVAFALDKMDPATTCLLKDAAEPLQWVTERLKGQVTVLHGMALALNLGNNCWEIKTSDHKLFSKNVVLAIGAGEKQLSHVGPQVISLDVALDVDKLAGVVGPDDQVAVFGSSHSAVLALANLVKVKVGQVVNFYRSPHQYAIDMDGWILFDNTGLKGFTAKWAREHLDGKHPRHLKRMLLSDHAFEETFALCNKVIYGVGFERRKIPVLEQFDGRGYNDKTGIIAPGLFGVGIAFPQAHYDPLMNLELRVGLWKFMDYLNKILPLWLRYSN